MKPPLISIVQALHYEVYSTWWTSYIPTEFLQRMVANYFAWKVNRKHSLYVTKTQLGQMLRERQH